MNCTFHCIIARNEQISYSFFIVFIQEAINIYSFAFKYEYFIVTSRKHEKLLFIMTINKSILIRILCRVCSAFMFCTQTEFHLLTLKIFVSLQTLILETFHHSRIIISICTYVFLTIFPANTVYTLQYFQ